MTQHVTRGLLLPPSIHSRPFQTLSSYIQRTWDRTTLECLHSLLSTCRCTAVVYFSWTLPPRTLPSSPPLHDCHYINVMKLAKTIPKHNPNYNPNRNRNELAPFETRAAQRLVRSKIEAQFRTFCHPVKIREAQARCLIEYGRRDYWFVSKSLSAEYRLDGIRHTSGCLIIPAVIMSIDIPGETNVLMS